MRESGQNAIDTIGPSVSTKITKELAKLAKRLGFIDYDLRKPLNNGQKSAISRAFNKYRDVFESPDSFQVVAHKGRKEKKALDREFYTNKKFSFIPKSEVYQTAKIVRQRDWIFDLFKRQYLIRYSPGGRKREIYFLFDPREIMSALELIDEIDLTNKIPPGWVWSFMFKGFNQFVRTHGDLQSAMNYLRQMAQGYHFHADTKEADKQVLISSLVLILKER